jgi:hypothetical protein
MTPRISVAAAGMVATAWLAGMASAAPQNPPQRDQIESMPIRVGPFGLSPTLTITDMGVDSNIFNEAGTPERDFTMTMTPRLDARVHAGRALLSIGTAPGFVYYQNHPDQRSINYVADGRADLDFGRLQAFAAGTFADTRERLNAEIDARASRTVHRGEAGAQLTIAPKSAVSVSLRRAVLRFDPDEEFDGISLSHTLNSQTDDLDGAFHFFLTPLTTLSLTTTVQHDRFDESPSRNADSVRMAPGVKFDPAAFIGGSLAAGYKRFDPANPALQSFSGLVVDGLLGTTIADRTHLDLTVKRDVAYSFEETEPYYLSTSARLTLTQHLAGRFDVQATGGRERLGYRGFGQGSGRTDRFSLAGAGLIYRVRENTRIGMNVEYAHRTSDRPDREFRRTRVFGSLWYGL